MCDSELERMDIVKTLLLINAVASGFCELFCEAYSMVKEVYKPVYVSDGFYVKCW